MEWTWQIWLAPLQAVGVDVIHFAPHLIAAILILGVGLFLGWLVKILANKLCQWLKLDAKFSDVWLFRLWSQSLHGHKPSETISNFSYFLILFVTVLLSVKILGVDASEKILSSLLVLIPRVFSFMLILFLGFLMAMFFSVIAQLVLASSGIQHPNFWGKIIAWGTMGVSVIFSLEQLGLVGKFLTLVVLILLGALGLAAAMAFGLGCKDLAREFLIELLKDEKKSNTP